MKQNIFLICVFAFLFSCNRIETGNSLSNADIEFIRSLHLLDKGETIYKFYSEFRNENAGNFFTGKRIASYWIDERDSKKNAMEYAFYSDIEIIDTVYYAGATYCPYMLVTKTDGSRFKVSVDGKREEIKSFFEDALREWKRHNKDKAVKEHS